MSPDYLSVASHIRLELPKVLRMADRAALAWQRAATSNDDLFLDSVALSLHGLYSGLERIFELIASKIDTSLPDGGSWRRELLRQMAIGIPGVRPAVISDELAERLDRYRGFRHVVRNVYSYVLDPQLIGILVDGLAPMSRELEAQLSAFAATMESVGAE